MTPEKANLSPSSVLHPDPQAAKKHELFLSLVNADKGPFHLVGWDAFSDEWYDYDDEYETWQAAEAAGRKKIEEIGDHGSLTDEVWIEGRETHWHWKVR